MITVIYTIHESSPYRIGEIELTLRQLTRRLNREGRRLKGRQLYTYIKGVPFIFNMIWLPNGREWDTVNGWRFKKGEADFRGPERFQDILDMLDMLKTLENDKHAK